MKKWFRHLLKGTTLTTALFIFQACYGTPDWLHREDVVFKVVSAEDGTPIKGVEILTRAYDSGPVEGVDLDWNLCGYTAEDGTLETLIGTVDGASPQFRFQDSDALFSPKDSVIQNCRGTILVKLQKKQFAE